MTLLLPIARIPRDGGAAFGAKAVGCARMRRMGLPVPDGFGLATQAFEQHLNDTGLADARFALLQAFRTERDEDLLQSQAKSFCEAVANTPLNPSLDTLIAEALKTLPGPFAVRSSQTLEDGAASACAGVFETQLDVAPHDVARAICDVWASAYRYEAITHILSMGLSPGDLASAVLVQTMVDSQFSGILYTRIPDGSQTTQMKLVGHAGRGDELVSGRSAGVEISIGRDGPRHALPEMGLTRAQSKKLLSWALALESAYRSPVDIEWAHDGTRLFLTQVRPITTVDAHARPIRWDRELAEERFPDPISPLGWSCLRNAFKVNLDTLDRRFGLKARRPEDVARTFNHYVYSNATFFKIPSSLTFRWETQVRFLPRYFGAIARNLKPVAALYRLGRPRRGILGKDPGDPRFGIIAGIFEAFVFTHAREIATNWEAEIHHHLAAVDALNEPELRTMTDPELRRHMDHVIVTGNRFMEPDLAIFVVKSACIWMVEQIGRLCEMESDFLLQVTAGLADNVTLELGQAMAQLAHAMAQDPAIAQSLQLDDSARVGALLESHATIGPAWRQFLTTYGHVTTTWDLRIPTWGEAPETAIRMLKGVSPDAHADRSERQRLRQDAIARLMDQLSAHPRAMQFAHALLEILHNFIRYDEEHHFQSSRLFRPSRKVFAELARRFVDRGIIVEEDDLYFLNLSEVETMFASPKPHTLRYLVARRRESFARAWTTAPPRAYVGEEPELENTPETSHRGVIEGRPASPGRVRGRIRHIATPEHLKGFTTGDILVTRSPNPAWTPLYAAAGALVTATGSPLSHGFISAREYGLPAVSGIPIHQLQNGQLVEVDGFRGCVYLLDVTGASDDHHAPV